MREKSLSFRLLDTHVVAGRADDVAYVDADGSLTFARLLHESASLAGALNQLGVQPGGTVHLDLTGRAEVLAVLALVRLEARAEPGASVSLAGDPVVARVGDDEFAWDVLMKAGRGDPAPAARFDSEDYAQHALAEHGELLAPLLAGEKLTR
ncbi:hypothetical protein ASD11_08370 [Aeromicrobium sp. Root495]|uniref:AMP-binding protein n=1 Tax=Aeromicrobium sp. Root495 TaxID=1736550 RepID=UPI0006FC89DE|nr:AMP-binding protein [Aeromicrobium sp. Root495]KQY59559.1 hypothetical protein ASD11_08370 [Aeromicrobium sp. Root495]